MTDDHKFSGFAIDALDVLHAPFTLISLGLTWPALVVSVLVLMSWHHKYLEYCRTLNRTPNLILIAGVYLSFMGFALDNTWWGIAWSLDFVDPGHGRVHYWRNFFFKYGVFFNVFFRQGLGLWAGILHIHAENMSRSTEIKQVSAQRRTKKIIAISAVIGVAYVLVMVILRIHMGVDVSP